MTEPARPILRGEAEITLRKDSIARAKDRPQVRALVGEEDAPLLAALKARRRALAEAAGVPAYVVFPDRTLIEMAQKRPETLDQMAQVNGVGATKLERYGATFLEVITGESPEMHPARRQLAGRESGAVFDRLQEIQLDLARGTDGAGKYLACTHSTLRQIAERRPGSLVDLGRIPGMGEQKLERFGPAFLEVLAEAS